MHLRTKIIDDHPYLYAVDNVWNSGSPKVAFQTYLGRADLLQGAQARPLIKTFHFGAVAVLLQLARQLQIVEIVNQVVGSSRSPSVGDYLLLAALNRAVKPRSKRAFAEWYEATSLKRALNEDIREIITDYGHLWLARNRVGGLADSVARLEKLRADYN